MAEVSYRRNIAGEHYVLRHPFGPVGKDLRRRVILVNLDARRRAPRGEGRAADQWAAGYPPGGLARSIHSEVIVRNGNLVGRVIADARRQDEDTSYAASVHEGAAAHGIVPRRKRVLRWPAPDGSDIFRLAVRHPGIRRPQAFLRNSLEAAAR